CFARSMKAQVLTTRTSAVAASFVSSCPACCARPSITSESTRFFGQPRETSPTFMFATKPSTQRTQRTQSHSRSRPLRPLRSRVQPGQHPRIRDRFPQVIELTDPGYDALDAHAEAAVRHGAVAAQIETPLQRFPRERVRPTE